MQPAIRVENLSKRYQLGLTHAGSIRELVNNAAARLAGRKPHAPLNDGGRGHDHVWALRDVSFDVEPGEAIGIIGRNGAGKSTLLKILSRITRPTGGQVQLHGRVASLLEVGTGFHPELTGRENVYMNGTILGMTRREIKREFDSIVQFAEVQKFIDTPVKRYSSGMTVRLGFAVAAHLNPEILIVDEVLAVGDAEFQRRCLGKMDDIARSGRTVLFVSHNMMSIRQLTTRCLLIGGGRLEASGEPESVIEQYLAADDAARGGPDSIANLKRPKWLDDRAGSIVKAALLDDGNRIDAGRVRLAMTFEPARPIKGVWVGVTVFSASGAAVGSAFSESLGPQAPGAPCGLAMTIDCPALAPGRYYLRLGVHDRANRLVDMVDEVLPFQITSNRLIPHGFSDWHQAWGPMKLRMDTERE